MRPEVNRVGLSGIDKEKYKINELGLSVDRYIIRAVTILIAFLLIFFLLFPVYIILVRSFFEGGVVGLQNFTIRNYVTYFTTPRITQSLYNSLFVSVVTAILTTIIAFFFAYALTRTTIKGKAIFNTIGFMPLIAPSLIQALALIYLFGRNGLITRNLLGGVSWSIYGAWGIIISEILYCFPHALVILYTTLSAVDIRMDEAAESLGANSLQTFFKITLPSAKFGIMSALAMVFNLTITDFGNPVVIGGDYTVLATEIYAQVTNLYRFDLGATVSVILLIPSMAAFLVNYYISRRGYAMISGEAKPFIPPSRPLKKWGFTIFCSLISLSILGIFATVFIGSFVNVWPYDFSLTTRHYNFPSLGGYRALWTSFKIAIAVSILGPFLTLLSGYIIEKVKPIGANIFYLIAVMPAAIPGLVLGLGYILAFNRPYYFFFGTVAIIIICEIIMTFSLGTISSITNLKNIDPSMEEAAKSLGATSIGTFVKVIFPLSRVAFMQNFRYCFMRAMTTISAVIFLVTATLHLAAVEIIFLDNDGWTASANAMATCISVIVLVVLGIVKLIEERMKASAAS